MKKYLFIAFAAIAAFAFTSCDKPEPEVKKFNLSVDAVDGTTVTVSINPADTNMLYIATFMTDEELKEFATDEAIGEALLDNAKKTVDYYNALMGMFGMPADYTLEDVLMHGVIDHQEVEDLDPFTNYYFIAIEVDLATVAAVGPHEKVAFTTGEGAEKTDPEPSEPSEDDYYAYEPQTATTFDVPLQGAEAEGVYYNEFYAEATTNFSMYFTDGANFACQLDLNAVGAGLTTLPAGEYPVVDFENYESGNAVIAGDLGMYQYYCGSYYQTNSEIWWIQKGTLTVNGNGTYTLKGTLKSYYGSTMNINYSGAIAFEEGQLQAPARPVLAKKTANVQAPKFMKNNTFTPAAKRAIKK